MNAPRTKAPRRILSVSRNAVLLASRNAVLRQAGYEVETTMQDQHALEILKQGNIDVVVLGDSIAFEERNGLANSVRALNQSVPILVLKLAGEPIPESATTGMDSLDGPEMLLNLLKDVLAKSDAQAA